MLEEDIDFAEGDDDDRHLLDSSASSSLQPFRYEPRASSAVVSAASHLSETTAEAEPAESDEDFHQRVGHTNWCQCGRCHPMRREVDCVCCHEVSAAENKRKEQEGLACVTEHSEFEAVCIRKSVLEVAMVAYQEFRARCDPWTNR